jgi:DNA-binding LytR/AlgR family response regulator
MVLKLEKCIKQNDIEITIKYPHDNKTIDRLVSLIKLVDIQLTCYIDDEIKNINASDIFYIESVDKKTIVFCENDIFYVKGRLYQIYEKLKSAGFVQINKYCILNINKLEKVKTLENSHLEAILSNGKSLYITRKYLSDIKRILQENENV